MSEAEIVEPTTVEQPVVHDAAPPLTEPEAPAPVAEETEDDGVIEIPTGEKLVTLTALERERAKNKALREERATLKATADKATEKDQQLAQLQQQLNTVLPMAQAYQAAVEAQRNQPPAQTGPTPEESAKYEKVAKQLDFYKQDGSLDLERAKSHLELVREEAQAVAQAQVAPIRQQTQAEYSQLMLQRALITKGPDGAQPDPDVLKALWQRMEQTSPQLTSTPQGAAQVWAIALGHTVAMGKGKKAPEPIPDPLHVERAGGRDVEASYSMNDNDKRLARDLNMTDKEYMAEVAKMPKGWGKGA